MPVRSQRVGPADTALQLLRERFGLPATEVGMQRGDCGACTIAIANGVRRKTELEVPGVHLVLVPGGAAARQAT